MRDQDYATLADYQPWPRRVPGWFLLEWDIALDRRERERFAANAFEHPDRVRVAPYMLYPIDRQVHQWEGKPPTVDKPWADMFGFGCIYFPQTVLDAFWEAWPWAQQGVFTDTVFSDWHRAGYDPVTVDFTVHPQHLHGD